jgi:hypothetical protein
MVRENEVQPSKMSVDIKEGSGLDASSHLEKKGPKVSGSLGPSPRQYDADLLQGGRFFFKYPIE